VDVSDADTCKIGDPNPSIEDGGLCEARLWQPGVPPYFCSRGAGHSGQHVAGTLSMGVVATWTGDGSDYEELPYE
jgi:hypothetical protein